LAAPIAAVAPPAALLVPLDALARIVGAHAPLNRHGEQARGDRHDAVGKVLAATGCNCAVQRINVTEAKIDNFAPAQHRPDGAAERAPVFPLRRRTLARQVLGLEALRERRDSRRLPLLIGLADRIGAAVDSAFKIGGFRARAAAVFQSGKLPTVSRRSRPDFVW
jgi:hypothetical protein